MVRMLAMQPGREWRRGGLLSRGRAGGRDGGLVGDRLRARRSAQRQGRAGVVRLGPVYTPPETQRHGYATALVADVSGRALADGATHCMLYADLANPTSNSIYQAVGYRRSTEAREYHFSVEGPVE